MNKSITKEILEQHFRCFTFSLFQFPEKYLPLIFQKDAIIPKHVAYLCPLCLKNFLIGFEKGLIPSTNFTLDHFPPESVGGKLKLITCKKCNNEAGRLYEAELIKKMNYEASKGGNIEALIKTKFKAVGVPGNYASFVKKNSKGEIILDFPSKLKNKTPFLKAWLDDTSKKNDWEVTLTIPRPDDRKILRAVLKAAYLICFVNWGYDFLFSSNGELIRSVLNGDEEYPTQILSFWFDEKNLPKEVQMPLGLCIIEKPVELETYVVNVPLKINGYSSIASVLIPYPGKLGWDKLKQIQEYQKKKSRIEVTFKQVIATLSKNIFDGYSRIWNEFIAIKRAKVINEIPFN